jgi:hypothetical protein
MSEKVVYVFNKELYLQKMGELFQNRSKATPEAVKEYIEMLERRSPYLLEFDGMVADEYIRETNICIFKRANDAEKSYFFPTIVLELRTDYTKH